MLAKGEAMAKEIKTDFWVNKLIIDAKIDLEPQGASSGGGGK